MVDGAVCPRERSARIGFDDAGALLQEGDIVGAAGRGAPRQLEAEALVKADALIQVGTGDADVLNTGDH